MYCRLLVNLAIIYDGYPDMHKKYYFSGPIIDTVNNQWTRSYNKLYPLQIALKLVLRVRKWTHLLSCDSRKLNMAQLHKGISTPLSSLGRDPARQTDSASNIVTTTSKGLNIINHEDIRCIFTLVIHYIKIMMKVLLVQVLYFSTYIQFSNMVGTETLLP